MMQWSKNYYMRPLVLVTIFLSACTKNENPLPSSGNGGGTVNNKDTSCVISTISQVNSGTNPESSLSVTYNSNYDVTQLVVYDSLAKSKRFEANLNYITADSVRIDQYQYLLLDDQKRVLRLVTKSDMSNPTRADNHVFDYKYNTEGYLSTKNLFINGSAKANFSTTYSYTNGNLTGCVMTTPSAGNRTVLVSGLSYDNNITIKNWIYTFSDGIEGYPYLTVLNFGKRVNNPLTRVVTKIYNPATGDLIDTWTTSYGNYKIDTKGFILSGATTGDLQQGMAAFYGKTNFYYTCH